MDGTSTSAPEGNLRDLERYGSEQAAGNRAVLDTLLRLLPAAHAEAVRLGDPVLAYSLLHEAGYILHMICDALTPPGVTDVYHRRLWRHPEGWPDPKDRATHHFDKTQLENAAAEYLARPWMSSGWLDWILIDSLSRREILAYETEVSQQLGAPRGSIEWWITTALSVSVAWLVELAVAASVGWWLWHEYKTEAPYQACWAAAAGAYYAWWLLRAVWTFPARRRVRIAQRKELRATAERIIEMRRCYNELQGPLLDPSRVRSVLLAAEQLGTRWSRATWPLLDNAITRHPHRWMTE